MPGWVKAVLWLLVLFLVLRVFGITPREAATWFFDTLLQIGQGADDAIPDQ